MRTISTFLILVLIFLAPAVKAQEISYGFRVGLNFTKLDGPLETAADGTEVEEFRFTTGFHVGADVRFAFTDLIGIKTGLTFYQRGGEQRFDGDGFQFFISDSGNRIKATGNRRLILDVTNSYLDIPLTAYYRFGEKIEVFGGGQISFLVGSVASGDLQFQGQSAITNTEIDLESVLLDYNYFKDGTPNPESLRQANNAIRFEADGNRISVPETITGYYDFGEKDKSIYNILDVGLQAGINFYLNRGLYFGAAINYGLLDATRDTYDVSRVESDDLEYIPRDDKDHHLTLQFSLGFSF
ncbi:MAG: porin family protein [Bacteroidota bacterium]